VKVPVSGTSKFRTGTDSAIRNIVLLSSHRDYETEKDWEWFRNDSAYSDALRFVPGESDGMLSGEKFEMMVTERWSSRVSSLA